VGTHKEKNKTKKKRKKKKEKPVKACPKKSSISGGQVRKLQNFVSQQRDLPFLEGFSILHGLSGQPKFCCGIR
jgi:hypothetical protein